MNTHKKSNSKEEPQSCLTSVVCKMNNGISEYELQRLKNIDENKEMMKDVLGQISFNTIINESKVVKKPRTKKHKIRNPREKVSTASRNATVLRTSRRLRGHAVEVKGEIENDDDAVSEEPKKSGGLKTMEEYFAERTDINPVKLTGKFTGWVNPEVMERFNIAENARDAWDSNGGGKFSFKNVLGDGMGDIGAKPHGWSSIKHATSKLLKKNPNAFFYRHVEPGKDQHQGDWSDEEKAKFLETVRNHGCGDKWGLFSTYIDNRVGYQCSNYYRQVILPEGLVFDNKYLMDGQGRAVYSAGHGRDIKPNEDTEK
eukprot:CFRG3665T1